MCPDRDSSMLESLIAPGVLDSLRLIREYIARIACAAGLHRRATYQLQLAVDEIATNIITHGYAQAGHSGTISIHPIVQERMLTISIEDTADAYLPDLTAPQSLDLRPEERQEGGLGLFLASMAVEHVRYIRVAGGNQHILEVQRPEDASRVMNSYWLAEIPLFASVPADDLQHLVATLQYQHIPAGTTVFHEGEAGNELVVVITGQLGVYKAFGTSEQRRIDTAGPHEYVGEMSLLHPGGRRTASVVADVPSELYVITRADFDALLHRHPTMAYQMVRVLSERLTSSHEIAIDDLRTKNEQLQAVNDELRTAQAAIIEKERLERELQVARTIQLSILPSALPAIAGYNVAARLRPAREVGGDFYDFIPLENNRVGIAIGDVTDKGVPAAIFMAQARALLRAEASRAVSTSEALRCVNHHLLDMNAQLLFVTVLYGVLDLATSTFTYVRAGHEPPLIHGENGVEILAVNDSLPLGIVPDPPLDECRVTVNPGSLLVLYTDGVTDARDVNGTRFGTTRFKDVVATHRPENAGQLCDDLLEAITAYQGAAPQHDDITVVVVHSALSTGRRDP